MSLNINPDLGDTFEVSQQGANWRFGYWYREDAGPKLWHLANFPADFAEFDVRFDSNYTGSKPKIDVLNIPGVADQTDIMTGSADQWEELTATFTPTSSGVCRLRASSQDTSATGQSFFDTLTVT